MIRPTFAERIEASRAEDLFEERAGILEFDAGFPRSVAETRAHEEVMPFSPRLAGGAL